MKIIFFGTSNVALPVLEALHKNHTVSAVVTTPDTKLGKKQELTESPVSVLANELKIPILKPEDSKSPEFLSNLQKLEAEIFIVVSYGKILSESVINLPKHKTLNIHFSKLPFLRGPAPIQFTLLQGETESWTSIFILDKEVDHGPILAQKSMPVDPADTFITLSQNLAHMSAKLLLEVLPDYAFGKLVPKEQDHTQATSTHHITREDGKIDWQKSAAEIYNQFRAFYPWPGIWTTWNGQTVKILDCTPTMPEGTPRAPGTVLDGGTIVCGENSGLKIKSLQLTGKKETTFDSFINGYRDFIGSKLG